jgi:hypothetical protein
VVCDVRILKTLLPSSFALEYTNKEVQANQEGVKLDGMICADVNLFSETTGALVIGLMKLVERFEFLTVLLRKSQVLNFKLLPCSVCCMLSSG